MPIKNLSLTKIWRLWLNNWVCHALLNFKIEMGLAGSIFELHPSNFVKIHIFWIPTNDRKTIFCWLCWYRNWKKDDPVLRPGVKESMDYPPRTKFLTMVLYFKTITPLFQESFTSIGLKRDKIECIYDTRSTSMQRMMEVGWKLGNEPLFFFVMPWIDSM